MLQPVCHMCACFYWLSLERPQFSPWGFYGASMRWRKPIFGLALVILLYLFLAVPDRKKSTFLSPPPPLVDLFQEFLKPSISYLFHPSIHPSISFFVCKGSSLRSIGGGLTKTEARQKLSWAQLNSRERERKRKRFGQAAKLLQSVHHCLGSSINLSSRVISCMQASFPRWSFDPELASTVLLTSHHWLEVTYGDFFPLLSWWHQKANSHQAETCFQKLVKTVSFPGSTATVSRCWHAVELQHFLHTYAADD